MLSMLLKEQGLPPLEAFHLLEFLGVSYEIDLHELNKGYQTSPKGSHVVVHTLSAPTILKASYMKAGVYVEEGGGGFVYKGPGWNYAHLSHPQEFLVIDGPPGGDPRPLEVQDSLFRVCRILCSDPGLGEDFGPSTRLNRASKWIRESVLEDSSLPSL